ncbi:MAG: tail fiber domain-containing protein [Saprospiraceae bacterium]
MLSHLNFELKSVFYVLILLVLITPNSLFSQKNVGINTSNPESTLEIKSQGISDSTSALNVTDLNNKSLMYIGDDGKVGVGTTSPGARFMVVGKDGAPTLNILNDGSNPMNPAIRVNDNGRVGIGTTSPGARFMVVGSGMTDASATINFTNAGGNSLFHIKDGGNVGIGTTSPAFKLDVDGDINASGVIRVNGMMVASDKRYKNSITSLVNSLAIIGQLHGTKYLLNDTKISEEEQFGFIAQELETVLPNLVAENNKGYKAVNYIGLIPVLTEGIKEQQKLIENQQKELTEVKARLFKIEALLLKIAQ